MSGGDHKTPRIASCNLVSLAYCLHCVWLTVLTIQLQELQSLADLTKPTGYSFFPMELAPVPVSWVAAHANVVSSTVHTSGGHFAVSNDILLGAGDIVGVIICRYACC